jgi:universal stress protein E
MEQFKHLLAALDLGVNGDEVTAGSRKALERAIWIARRVGASLTVFHSDTPDEYWDPKTGEFVPAAGGDDDRRGLIEKTLEALSSEGVETDAVTEVVTEVVIESESAWMAIVREVLRKKIDIVVAGKRTQVHSDDRRLGTVARSLLRKCPCAVWLEDPRESRSPSVVLAATDLTPVGDRAVELSASVAHALGAKLHIVHSYSLSMSAQMEGDEARRSYEQQKRDGAATHIERVLSTTSLAGAADVHIGLTSPTQAVLECVARLRPGLVVMGTVSRGGIPGFLMGNTAERLIDRIDCALLTVKPKDFVCPVTLG